MESRKNHVGVRNPQKKQLEMRVYDIETVAIVFRIFLLDILMEI